MSAKNNGFTSVCPCCFNEYDHSTRKEANQKQKEMESRASAPSAETKEGERDTERLNWMQLDYNFPKVRVTKRGIIVKGIHEWQPSLRAAIDAAMALRSAPTEQRREP